MNKAELIEALAARLGDRKAATSALDAVLAEVQAAVTKGDRVAITGFGVFEKRVRGARTARNPRTGESVKVKKTSVPAFRPGAGFKEMVASGKAPKNTAAAKKSVTATTTAKSTAAKKTVTKKTAPAKSTATKAAAKKTAPGKRATSVKKATTAKKTTAAKKSTAAKTASTRGTAATKKATAKKAPARKAAKR